MAEKKTTSKDTTEKTTERTTDQNDQAVVDGSQVQGQPEVPPQERAPSSGLTPDQQAAGEQGSDYSRASEEALENRVGASPAGYPSEQDLQNRLDNAPGDDAQ